MNALGANDTTFDRPALQELDAPSGDYRAYIAATDAPTRDGRAGPSACAFYVVDGNSTIELTQVLPGDRSESSENKAIVAGLLAALERIPTNSNVVVYSHVHFVVEAINGRLAHWYETGRLDGTTVAYASIWKRVLSRMLAFRSCRAELGSDAGTHAIIVDLLQRARDARPITN